MSTVSDINRRIWLLLHTRRCWWTAREVETQLALDRGSAYQRMLKMAGHGSIVRVSSKTSGARFAVLDGCTIPQGITVGELRDAANSYRVRSAPAQQETANA